MERIIELIEEFERTAGNLFPAEIIFARNARYRELKNELNQIINNLPVDYEEIRS